MAAAAAEAGSANAAEKNLSDPAVPPSPDRCLLLVAESHGAGGGTQAHSDSIHCC